MPAVKKPMTEEQRLRKNARTAERYKEQREKIRAYHAELYQKKKLLDPDFLAKEAAKSREWRKNNPEKERVVAERSRKKNAENRNAISRAWFAKNKEKRSIYQQNRRAKIKSSGSLSVDIYERLMVLQKGKCVCCRENFRFVKANVDHIIPLSLGGLNVDTNVQLLCQTCNNNKHSKHPIDFMQSRGFLL